MFKIERFASDFPRQLPSDRSSIPYGFLLIILLGFVEFALSLFALSYLISFLIQKQTAESFLASQKAWVAIRPQGAHGACNPTFLIGFWRARETSAGPGHVQSNLPYRNLSCSSRVGVRRNLHRPSRVVVLSSPLAAFGRQREAAAVLLLIFL